MTTAACQQSLSAFQRDAVVVSSASQLKGHIVRPAALGSDLQAKWQQFCDADPLYRSPFYRPQFTQAVGNFRSDAQVAVFEQGSRVVGFLPFHRVRGRIGKPIGGQINDFHGPILAPGLRFDSREILAAAGLHAYDFNHLPVTLGAPSVQVASGSSSPQMDLSGGYAAYLEGRDPGWGKAQRELRRRQRKTEAEIGPLRFVFDDRSDDVFARLIEMKDRQYARMGLRIKMGAGWTGNVLEQLRSCNQPDFAAVTSALYAGDRLIAAHFGLRSGSLLHWWFPAYDLALQKLGPGINLIQHCASEAAAHGIDLIDFGKGGEDFKLHFANRQVGLSEGSFVAPRTFAAGVRQGAATLVGWAGQLPLGRYRTHPGKIAARLVYGVGLPG